MSNTLDLFKLCIFQTKNYLLDLFNFKAQRKPNKQEEETIEISDKTLENIALLNIEFMLANCNKYTCIAFANSVLKYLSHRSKIVRQTAAFALYYIVSYCLMVMFSDNDPKRRMEIAIGLLNLSSKINQLLKDDLIPNDIKPKIEAILKFISSNLEKKRSIYFDEFVSFVLNDFTKTELSSNQLRQK